MGEQRTGIVEVYDLMYEKMHPHLDGLNVLSGGKRIAFIASCCERLWPNYVFFADVENWGSPKLLREALDLVWECVDGNRKEETYIIELVQACYDVTPESEAFASAFVDLAMDTGAAIIYGLQACINEDAKFAQYVGHIALRSIDTYLYLVNSPIQGLVNSQYRKEFDDWIRNAPLMREEIEKQRHDIELLTAQRTLAADFIVAFRQSSTTSGIFLTQRGLISR